MGCAAIRLIELTFNLQQTTTYQQYFSDSTWSRTATTAITSLPLGEHMTESTTPTMNRDDNGTVVHDKLEAAQQRVDHLEGQLAQADSKVAETGRKVQTQQGLVQGLQSEIRGGNLGAAADHSQAESTLNSLGREHHNYTEARKSLRAQLRDAEVELELYTALYGHSDIISEQDRAVELAEAQTQIRAILDPIIRKYRESDTAYCSLAETYKRYLRTNSAGLQGVAAGEGDKVSFLTFDDGTKLDGMGKHHAERVTERALTNIMADIKAELRGDKEPRNR